MASILDRYGIKEVCDVTFYTIKDDGTAGNPVLFIDTAKTSTVETTATTTYAQGGKGNPRLIGWDFGKEISVTLEDALFSPKSLALVYGDIDHKISGATTGKTVKKTKAFVGTQIPSLPTGVTVSAIYDQNGATVASTALVSNTRYYLTYEQPVTQRMEIEIGPNTFPGTYYVTADTTVRNETTGQDEYFQLIFPKAKIKSEQTLTMEAEGDPSVFNLSMDILRATVDNKNIMMKMVKYTFDGDDNAKFDGNIQFDSGN